MNPIVSRRHPLKFYTILIFAFAFYSFMAIFLWHATSKTLPDKNPIWLYLMSVLCAIMAIYTVVQYFKNTPVVILDETSIKINQKIYYWTDIEKIALTGKHPFKYIINHDMEGMALEFNDGTVRYLYDDVYSNLWEVKSFIYHTIVRKEQFYAPQQTYYATSADHEDFEYFKGSPFFSFRGVMAWSLPVFFLGLIITSNDYKTGLTFVLVFSLFWLFGNSFFMFYFGISENYLTIRNHHFLWVRKILPLSEIKEVIFETKSKWPNCMHVVTKDFRTHLYPAGTLSDKKWRQLLTVLRKNKVKVRNEIGI